MPVTAPETEARLHLGALISEEFTDLRVMQDRVHGSLGNEYGVVGIYPIRARAEGNEILGIEIGVQFYLRYDRQINPEQWVDPTKAETYAERFRRRVQATADPNTSRFWYYNVDEIVYTPDPTGNITRFEARVSGFGRNSALVETTG